MFVGKYLKRFKEGEQEADIFSASGGDGSLGDLEVLH